MRLLILMTEDSSLLISLVFKAFINSLAQCSTEYRLSLFCILKFLFCCSSSGICMAVKRASAIWSRSKGLINTDSNSSFEAPAISLRIKTPSPLTRVAINSLATKFIPSRTGVIMAISEVIYKSIRSSKAIAL